MVKVKVRDMTVGKKYKLNNGDVVVLEIKYIIGAGGSRNQEPIYKLVFSNKIEYIKDWDNEYDEVLAGGKRKTRRYRKSRKLRRKKSHRRR